MQLNKLTAASGLTILFDLNCLTRNDDGTWNSSNAEEIIAFSDRYNLSVIWELGNGKLLKPFTYILIKKMKFTMYNIYLYFILFKPASSRYIDHNTYNTVMYTTEDEVECASK